MNIVCEKCATVYRIDPAKIPPGGKKVKCSKCQHIFLANPPEDDARASDTDEDLAAELQEDAEKLEERAATRRVPGGEQKKRLLLRQDGTRYAMNDLATLQRWIVERRVSRDAEISEDGEVWEKVGERMDLLPFFGIVERSSRKRAARKQAGHDGKAVSTGVSDEDDEESTEQLELPDRAMTLNPADIAGGHSKLELEKALEAATRASMKVSHASGEERQEEQQEEAAKEETPVASSSAATPTKATVRSDEKTGSGNRAFVYLSIAAIVVAGGYFVKTQYIDVRHPDRGQRSEVQDVENLTVGSQTNPVRIAVEGVRPGDVQHAVPSPAPSPLPPPQVVDIVASPSPAVPGAAGSGTKTAGPSNAAPGTGETAEKSGDASAKAPVKVPEQPVKQPVVATKVSSSESAKPVSPDTATASQTTKSATSASRGTGASANRLITTGRTYLKNRQYDKAVEAFRGATEKSPNSALAHKELGLGLMNLADVNYASRDEYYREAATHFRQAVQLDGNFAEAYHLLGVTYMQMGKKEDAAKNLRLALEKGLSGDDATEARVFLQNLQDDLTP